MVKKNLLLLFPLLLFVANLTPSTDDKPSLLEYREVETIFHEFGHCLHGLLSDGKYQTTSGTNVFWDFVELPSQIMENWVGEKETLCLFAKHYKTDEIIPDELIKKIKKSQSFNAGLNFYYNHKWDKAIKQFSSSSASMYSITPF